jgi:hypothetical protein
MLEQIASAFADKDYQKANTLLKQFSAVEPDNPWLHLYLGSLHEATSEWDKAEVAYRQLLQNSTNQKLIIEARQGLERLENMACQQRSQAIARAIAEPQGNNLGVLVLEGIEKEQLSQTAAKFAKVVGIDPQTAKFNLPRRGWRVYRQGAIGELRYYCQQLQQAEVPCFATALDPLTAIKVFNVKYFDVYESSTVQAIGSWTNAKGEGEKVETVTFNWSEVTQQVEGLLPLFEEVFNLGVRNKVLRKTEILDYVGVLDLHLQQKNIIIRLCDRHYQFDRGIKLSSIQEDEDRFSKTTIRLKWNNLLKFVGENAKNMPVWSEFDTFAEAAVNRVKLLERFPAHIHLFRRQETPWDPAFHLYSTLAAKYPRTAHVKAGE